MLAYQSEAKGDVIECSKKVTFHKIEDANLYNFNECYSQLLSIVNLWNFSAHTSHANMKRHH